MLPRHRESEFPGPLGQPYSLVSSRQARAHAGPGRADIPLHGEPLAEMHANRRVRCPGIQPASNRLLDSIYKILYDSATSFYRWHLASQWRLAILELDRYLQDWHFSGEYASARDNLHDEAN